MVYLIVGIPAAIVFADVLQGTVTGTCAHQQIDQGYNCANSLLDIFTQVDTAPWQSSPFWTTVLRVSVYAFPPVCLVSSIPVFCIIIKYNLQENGFSTRAAFFWGVVFPWIAAFPLVHLPNVLAQVINFTSLVFVSFTSFIVPFVLYFKLQSKQEGQQPRGAGPASGSVAAGDERLLSEEGSLALSLSPAAARSGEE